jgi:hypothetical protein
MRLLTDALCARTLPKPMTAGRFGMRDDPQQAVQTFHYTLAR